MFLLQSFKSVVLIGPFKISADNYHAVDHSALGVYKTVHVVGSRRVTQNAVAAIELNQYYVKVIQVNTMDIYCYCHDVEIKF